MHITKYTYIAYITSKKAASETNKPYIPFVTLHSRWLSLMQRIPPSCRQGLENVVLVAILYWSVC